MAPLSSPTIMSRLIPYNALLAFSVGTTVAPSLFVFKLLVCIAYWKKEDPSRRPDADSCDNQQVEALMAYIMAVATVLGASVGLLATSPVQRLSDRYGRRMFLVGLPLLDVVSIGLLLFAFTLNSIPLIYTLAIVNTVLSAFAAKSTFLPTLIVADCASTEERTPWYSRIGAASTFGIALAFLSTNLVTLVSPNIFGPFYLAMALQTLTAAYAFVFIPETRVQPEVTERTVWEESFSLRGLLSKLFIPLKPLLLLLPRKNVYEERSWTLFLLSSCTFISMSAGYTALALIMYMQNHFHFTPGQNGYVLAWLLGSRFVYLILIFPIILKYGRTAYHRYQLRHPIHIKGSVVEAGTTPVSSETTPLLNNEVPSPDQAAVDGEVLVVEAPAQLANHFDVILAYFSLLAGVVGLLLVAVSTVWQEVIAAFGVLSTDAGFGPCLKSVFLACVDPSQASESLAALEILGSVAGILSPLLLGPVYAVLIRVGRAQVLFGIAACFHFVASLFLLPIKRI
ncbi:major facilitator superfamily domain-containing protein [Mrakia frigida]|uniref:major facilitator superfamily domain-containing protein n=1 Tax=Mrakia frigida TaxID=29902 RepID=UPI003FCC1E31